MFTTLSAGFELMPADALTNVIDFVATQDALLQKRISDSFNHGPVALDQHGGLLFVFFL
jgi:hypothetical protein